MSVEVSKILLAQRVRNRIIEYFELASSYDKQLAYGASHACNVPNEITAQWQDWADVDHPEPVFSSREQHAIRRHDIVWKRVAEDVYAVDGFPDLNALFGSAPWEQLRIGASEALEVFMLRGKFMEDAEVFSTSSERNHD